MKIFFPSAFFVLVAAQIFLSSVTLAGDSVGGGGHVVRCQSGGGYIYELLDYYEARVKFQELKPDLGPASLTVREKVHYALSRLKKIDPDRWKALTEASEDFLRNSYFLNSELPKTQDVGKTFLENDCWLLQLAYQEQSPLPFQRRFFISDYYWKKLSTDHQAGLVLHEAVFLEGMKFSKTSEFSRYFNAILSTEGIFEKMDLMAYLKILENGLPRYQWNQYLLMLGYGFPKFYANGQLKSGVIVKQSESISIGKWTFPFESGHDGYSASFREDGTINWFKYIPFKLKIHGVDVHTYGTDGAEFTPQGTIRCFQAYKDSYVKKKDGSLQTVKQDRTVFLDSDEYFDREEDGDACADSLSDFP